MKRQHTYSPAARYALSALGAQIAVRRRELRWTASELAGRLGVTPPTVSRIERGAPGTAVGTVLEAAVLCGVPLFGVDPASPGALAPVAELERARLALLPALVRPSVPQADDDF